ncbi:hypothetical protein C7974DRAFT_380843 [Boeremia exigua]|uniref:uncharacterized protein n=1 Tax=Boeremia exigua TaxID=749465 RepID=UPI001E8E0ECA|nr:uncharacterized protein C7974DRAFT_380843 [Boeremia exigua]KAH6613128.1 hypothetical protein C7974DRAFT_380843 [Boeremia exigua]
MLASSNASAFDGTNADLAIIQLTKDIILHETARTGQEAAISAVEVVKEVWNRSHPRLYSKASLPSIDPAVVTNLIYISTKQQSRILQVIVPVRLVIVVECVTSLKLATNALTTVTHRSSAHQNSSEELRYKNRTRSARKVATRRGHGVSEHECRSTKQSASTIAAKPPPLLQPPTACKAELQHTLAIHHPEPRRGSSRTMSSSIRSSEPGAERLTGDANANSTRLFDSIVYDSQSSASEETVCTTDQRGDKFEDIHRASQEGAKEGCDRLVQADRTIHFRPTIYNADREATDDPNCLLSVAASQPAAHLLSDLQHTPDTTPMAPHPGLPGPRRQLPSPPISPVAVASLSIKTEVSFAETLQTELDTNFPLSTQTLHHILKLLVPDCEAYKWYNAGSPDKVGFHCEAQLTQRLDAVVVFVALFWSSRWILLRYVRPSQTVQIFDSLQTDSTLPALLQRTREIGLLLGREYETTQLVDTKQPTNPSDSGIALIVHALHAAAGVQVSRSVNITLWRLLLQRAFAQQVSEISQGIVMDAPQGRTGADLDAAMLLVRQLMVQAKGTQEDGGVNLVASFSQFSLAEGELMKGFFEGTQALERLARVVRIIRTSLMALPT